MARCCSADHPGAGRRRSTKAVVHRLRDRGETLAGFTTSDIRRGGRRTGFTITGMGGLERLLAVRGGPGPKVGSYGVDVRAFEEVALLEIENGLELGATLVIDEIGKMELLSAAFRELVGRAMEADRVIATVQAHADPFTDAIKRRRTSGRSSCRTAATSDLVADHHRLARRRAQRALFTVDSRYRASASSAMCSSRR